MEDSREGKDKKLGELCAVNIPIQMVAASDRDGKLTPIYFRFETPEHMIERVKIEETHSRDECMFVGIREKKFICSAVINEERRIMEIRYNVDSQKWRIFQFLS